MSRKFDCAGSTYSIDQAINGQTPLTFYDSLAQIALKPDLRDGAVMCYWKQGVEGLLSQIQSAVGADKRMVKTNPYYWTEYCTEETITTTVKKSTNAVPGAGVAVTVLIDESSHSSNGKYSKPRAGYRAYIKELQQTVNITLVTKTVNGQHTIELTPINNQVLDLTRYTTYTLLVDQLRMYKKGDSNPISKHGLVSNPPALRKGYVQMFEDGIEIHQDELNGYAYDVDFKIVPGLDPITGKARDYWAIPAVNQQLQAKLIDSININTLFGERDDVAQEGFDGLITTARRQGMFNASYDPASGISFSMILQNMVRNLRKTAGCTDYMLMHDFGFEMDWSNGIGQMIKDFSQNHVYQLFGQGGEGVRNFQNFQFKDFSSFGYNFRLYRIDAFDNIRYGNILANFALMLPACTFTDTNGKKVPPVTYVNIQRAEDAPVESMWVDNRRLRGERFVDAYVQHTYGMEIHCASKLGVLTRK